MQKLQGKLKNTPKDASQVLCSVNSQLNRVEKLSVENKVLTCNTPDGNLRQHKDGSDLRVLNIVYVLNQRGQALMPTTQSKSRHLIKGGKAKIIKRIPFTIKLLIASGENKQPVILGIDPGYENVGISARTEKKELIRMDIVLRKDISQKLTEKRMYRRGRRNKLWYREPRWLNRKATKKLGWIAPSVQYRLDSHIRLIGKICKLLPVSKIIVEVANFDIQKINNPEISGKEYQQGNLYGYENIKSYLIAREQGKCQLCGKESTKGISFRTHHIIQRKDGGTDRLDNLVLLHEKCHEEVHKKGLKFNKSKQFKAETFMSTIRWKLVEELKKILTTEVTYGYVTKIKRNELNLEKTHSNDAFVISEGTNQERCRIFNIQQKRKNNRCLQLNRKGFIPSIRRKRYFIQPCDLVKISCNWQSTKGSHCKGTRIIVGKKSININQVKNVFHIGSLIWRTAIPPTAKAVGFLAVNFHDRDNQPMLHL